MRQFPRLWAAIYSMHRSSAEAGTRRGRYAGRLCVLAQNGRLAPLPKRGEEREHTSGNGDADKAALAYAARWAPKPIVWVSDGQVEAETRGNWPAVDALLRRHRIVRVLTIEDAIAYLRGQKVRGWTACSSMPARLLRRGAPLVQESHWP
jgi:hypothetical protein